MCTGLKGGGSPAAMQLVAQAAQADHPGLRLCSYLCAWFAQQQRPCKDDQFLVQTIAKPAEQTSFVTSGIYEPSCPIIREPISMPLYIQEPSPSQ